MCRFFGEYLLQTGTNFHLNEFTKLWQQALPGGDDKSATLTVGGRPETDRCVFRADLSQLKGIALVDTKDQTVKNFPEWKLPENIQDRLSVLFQMRSLWTLDDLEPFVTTCTTPKLNVNALLTKYARASTINKVKHFCAKHRK